MATCCKCNSLGSDTSCEPTVYIYLFMHVIMKTSHDSCFISIKDKKIIAPTPPSSSQFITFALSKIMENIRIGFEIFTDQ